MSPSSGMQMMVVITIIYSNHKPDSGKS